MASRRQRRTIAHKKKKNKKKRDIRAATMKKKKIDKEESKPAPQATGRFQLYAARTGRISRRQDTVGEATAPIKEHDDSKGELGNERRWQKRTCSFCGVSRIHENDHFCPYNYINGAFNLSTCRARCQPGKHPLLLASSSGSGSGSHHLLRCLVRVTNVALSAIPGESDLCQLFRRFGPLVGSNLTSMSLYDPVGFGWVAFESREHAEEAIDKLNGHLVGDRKLRVDWVYPQT